MATRRIKGVPVAKRSMPTVRGAKKPVDRTGTGECRPIGRSSKVVRGNA